MNTTKEPTRGPLSFPLRNLELEDLPLDELREGDWLTNIVNPDSNDTPHDTGTSFAGVIEPIRIVGKLSIESGYLILRGKAQVQFYQSPCDRCLEPTGAEFTVNMSITSPMPSRSSSFGDEDGSSEDETAPVFTHERVDVTDASKANIAAEWPRHLLCKPDCAGLCSQCGDNLNDGPCSCNTEQADPRWAALKNVMVKK